MDGFDEVFASILNQYVYHKKYIIQITTHRFSTFDRNRKRLEDLFSLPFTFT